MSAATELTCVHCGASLDAPDCAEARAEYLEALRDDLLNLPDVPRPADETEAQR